MVEPTDIWFEQLVHGCADRAQRAVPDPKFRVFRQNFQDVFNWLRTMSFPSPALQQPSSQPSVKE